MELPFDSETKQAFVVQAKKLIRKRMRAIRQSVPASARAEKSSLIVGALAGHPLLLDARGVALFWPILERGEVDLRELDASLRARGVRVYYPVMEPTERGYSTGFRQSLHVSELEARGTNFAAPPPSAPLAARGDIDVVVVPALAADARGHRIGYGKGYYDATLPDVCPPAKSVLVVYDFQLEGELPSEEHDQPVNWVVTEKRVLEVRPVSLNMPR